MKKLLLALFILPLLAACATPIPSAQMMPAPRTYSYLEKNGLTQNLSIGTVSLSDAMPTSGLIVTATEFKNVLKNSTAQAGWLTLSGKARYTLNADFVEQQIPFSLFNSKVVSIVDYTLIDHKTSNNVYQQRVTIPCVVTFAEEINADLRVLKARECAVGENVTHVLRDLNNRF